VPSAWQSASGRAPVSSPGLQRGLAGLLGCRCVLGMSEAAGIPAAGKAIHQYLLPSERALGNALNQAGVKSWLMLAPPVATWIAVTYGWRQAFLAAGCLGLIWIPVWNWTARVTPRAALAGGDEPRPFAASQNCCARRACGPGAGQRSEYERLFAVDQLDHAITWSRHGALRWRGQPGMRGSLP